MGCINGKPNAGGTNSSTGGAYKMPEQDYTSIQEIVDTARSNKVTGLLDLGNQPANEGEEMEAGLLNLNKLYWDEAPDLTGLSITQLRTKANDIGGIECALTLTNLTMLDMSECELTEVNDGIGSLTKLEELNLSENKIKELPATVGQLGSLKVLLMFKNMLSKLPEELGKCSALEEVNFFNNKLIKLPASFAGLTELTEMNVGGNKLKTLPKTDAWTKLESFSCHQNTLIMLPSFAGMTALTFLKMDYNKVLGELPDFGTGMTNLSHLEINHCMYSKLPATIGSMTALKTINCQSNEITECETDFANLTELDTFNMSGNKKLALLPANVENCASLRVFFFQDTAVTSLPDGLGSLTKIERIIAPKAGLDAGAEATIKKLEPVTAGNGGWVKQM
jgi:Leucine-rich repeat (LRR) protein